MNCDLCGKEGELVRAAIEGTELNVCQRCGRFGKVLGKQPSVKAPKVEKPKKSEPLLVINPKFPAMIKQKREELGMKQGELAKAISEKESVIHKLETGTVPGIELAKKLEGFLRIKLIEEYREDSESVQRGKGAGLTLGDFIKVKK